MAQIYNTIKLLNDFIHKLMLGKMGIKRVILNNTEVYKRSGGYFYIELDNSYKG